VEGFLAREFSDDATDSLEGAYFVTKEDWLSNNGVSFMKAIGSFLYLCQFALISSWVVMRHPK
jgi:hypothetical protein